MNKKLIDLEVGDKVERNVAGILLPLEVTEVKPDSLICSLWEFCRKTGAEIDEYLGWGPQHGITGSFIVSKTPCTPDESATSIWKSS